MLLRKVDSILKKRVCKQNLNWHDSSSSSKRVFILLAKVITLNIGLVAIDIKGLGLKLISRQWVSFQDFLGLED